VNDRRNRDPGQGLHALQLAHGSFHGGVPERYQHDPGSSSLAKVPPSQNPTLSGLRSESGFNPHGTKPESRL
jgi:hypothetical protein